jgi:simple sugar transport system ATP-binding protein
MDEPTSVLTPQEVEQLFDVLRKLAAQGCSILYISHKLHEIKALCDTATILRGGRLVDTCDPKQETSRSLAEKMIGAGLKDITRAEGRSLGQAKLVVSHLSTPKAGHFDVPVDDVSFTVRAGEIRSHDAQAITIDGHPLGLLDTTGRRKRGLCAVPEERNGHAAVGDFTLSDNSVLTARDRLGMVVMGLINSGAART